MCGQITDGDFVDFRCLSLQEQMAVIERTWPSISDYIIATRKNSMSFISGLTPFSLYIYLWQGALGQYIRFVQHIDTMRLGAQRVICFV